MPYTSIFAPFHARILTISPRISLLNCILSLFFQHKESGTIIYPEYTSAPKIKKRNYQGVLRHYIHLGHTECFEFCNVFLVSTVTLHALVNCCECKDLYLRRRFVPKRRESNRGAIGIHHSRCICPALVN